MALRSGKVLGFGLLDWLIIRQFLGTFFFTLALFLSISVIFDLTEKVDEFIEHGATFKAIILDYYLNFVPYFGNLFSSLFIFIAVIYFTSRMAYRSEIIAMLCAGLSFNRLIRPYFFCAFVLACLSFVLTGYILPPANKKRIDFENTYVNSVFVNVSRNIHLKLNNQGYAYLESFNLADSTGFRFSLEHYDANGTLKSKLFADRIRWITATSSWRAESGYVRKMDGLRESIRSFPYLDTVLNMKPKDFGRPNTDVSNMSNTELATFINTKRMRGEEGLEFYLVKQQERYAMPFSTFVLTLIGVSLSSRKVRGGIGLQIGIGIVISFAYILFMQFTTVFSQQAGLPPWLGAWIPNLLFGSLAVYLAWKAPK
jgi:lipopolysaccharide export system permease protein